MKRLCALAVVVMAIAADGFEARPEGLSPCPSRPEPDISTTRIGSRDEFLWTAPSTACRLANRTQVTKENYG